MKSKTDRLPWRSRPATKMLYFCSSMKLFDTLLLALGVVFIIISIYEVMAVGLSLAYPYLMLALGSFFWFTYRKKSKE